MASQSAGGFMLLHAVGPGSISTRGDPAAPAALPATSQTKLPASSNPAEDLLTGSTNLLFVTYFAFVVMPATGDLPAGVVLLLWGLQP
jgi:hypothetical protein